MLLEQIQQTNDIKKINPKDYPLLAEEIRQFLIEKISVTGGHLGSNLGAVELTMAMHIALNLPEDKIVWDVGHQSYTHKLLTGRREGFDHLRKYGGMSGFPKRKESDCDSFDTGHSSTSISAGLGLVRARDIQGKTNTVVSVIGDGALTGGMAYEALNNAARMETNFIIILNDNNMSISENVGGVSKYLNNIRTSNAYLDIKDNIYDALRNTRYGDGVVTGVRRAKNSLKQLVIPGMWFEDMGITYLGPVDGHDVNGLVRVIREAKLRADGTEKAGAEAVSQQRAVCVESVRVYNRSEYVSDYLLRGNTRCWSVLYRRSAIGQIRFREDLSIGEDMMFLMDLLMQISSVSITEYRGYFYRINEQGATLKPFKPSYMDEIKSWELACRLVEKEFPSQKGRVYSILAVSAMLAAGKIARLPGAERKKYQAEVAQCHSAVQKGLAASGAKEELPKGYRIKTMLFTACPALYLALYHHWKG